MLTKPARCWAVSSGLVAIVVALLPGSQCAKVRPSEEAISVKFRFGEMKVKRIFDVPLVTPAGGYRGVEQLVARRAHNPKVVSSSLAPATKETKKEQSEMVALFDCNDLVNRALALPALRDATCDSSVALHKV